MDLFYKGSKCELPAVRLLRKGLLAIAQNSGSLKNRVMKYGCPLMLLNKKTGQKGKT